MVKTFIEFNDHLVIVRASKLPIRNGSNLINISSQLHTQFTKEN